MEIIDHICPHLNDHTGWSVASFLRSFNPQACMESRQVICLSHRPSFEAMKYRTSSSYNLTFTAASLRPELARVVAETYLATDDWQATKEKILSSNALQCRSSNSTIRLERELRQRLATLTRDQLVHIAQATAEARTALSWLAVCKHSPFAFEFASEVLRDKLFAHDPVLRPSDYESYIDNKSILHPGLVGLTPSSKAKIRQVLFRMLFEAGLVTCAKEAKIQRPVVSPEVLRLITDDKPKWLAGFLVPDTEIFSH